MKPLVYILILNWNNFDDTSECIDSVLAMDYSEFFVILLDNGSTDDSVSRIKDKYSSIEVVENGANMGFAAGNNVGIKKAIDKGADYVFILNNDIVVDKMCLNNMINVAEKDIKTGISAPKVYYHDRKEIINSMGTKIDWSMLRPYLGFCKKRDIGQFNKIKDAEILVGCALLIKKELISRIGIFDENFFMIHEDADLCFRSLEAGFKNMVIPEAVVYHKASTTLKKYSTMSTYYSTRNFLFLAYKHASGKNRSKTYIGLFVKAIRNAFRLLFKKGRGESMAFFQGVSDYFLGRMGKSHREFK